MWLRIFKHLLPNARAWRITVDKTLRNFFEGLTGLGTDSKAFLDNLYDDLNPQKTSVLEFWETQFALPETGLSVQERRDRLDATWKALGGQDPRYIQDTLQAAGFDVYVHEFWEFNALQPLGGSVNNDVIPVVRDPFDYLDDGSGNLPFLMVDGAADAQDGDAIAMDGSRQTPAGYPLVNKVLEAQEQTIGDGSQDMQDGGPLAMDNSVQTIYTQKQYIMPLDPDTYPYYLYIGGQNFPDQANIPESRRDEFEDLCLKICPLEQWLGILVNYS